MSADKLNDVLQRARNHERQTLAEIEQGIPGVADALRIGDKSYRLAGEAIEQARSHREHHGFPAASPAALARLARPALGMLLLDPDKCPPSLREKSLRLLASVVDELEVLAEEQQEAEPA